jgi:hypothetical protein
MSAFLAATAFLFSPTSSESSIRHITRTLSADALPRGEGKRNFLDVDLTRKENRGSLL